MPSPPWARQTRKQGAAGERLAVHWLTKGFLDLLFPPRCLVCRRFGEQPLCGTCSAQVELIRPPLCHRCGIPFDPQARGGPLCASCRQAQRLPYAIGRSVARYEGAAREAVHRLKYDGKRVLCNVLGEMMASALLGQEASHHGDQGSCPTKLDDGRGEERASADGGANEAPRAPEIPFDRLSLIVPVPLHPVRARERGFNQAELLCGPLARRAGVPVAIHCLQRVKLNPPQVAIPAKLRRANVRGAFAVTDPPAVADRMVLVFDDVWTTGATLLECARVLRQAGAAEVYLLSLCRTVRPAPAL